MASVNTNSREQDTFPPIKDYEFLQIIKHPRSCVSLFSSHTGLLGFLGCFVWLSLFGTTDPLVFTLITIASTALPVLVVDMGYYKVYKNESTGLDWTQDKKPFCWQRVSTKLIGLYSLWGIIAFSYWLFPEYNTEGYQPFYHSCLMSLAFLLIGAFFYISFIDRRMKDPEDGLYKWGCFLRRKANKQDKPFIIQYCLSWVVKALFLPIMFVGLVTNISSLSSVSFFGRSFLEQVDYLICTIFTIDLLFGTIGYIMTFRLFDSHVKSTEPTLLGWLVTLVCYFSFPFSSVFLAQAIDNADAWASVVSPMALPVQIIWASIILLLLAFYTWATIVFGIRFSNLTNRGIITNGPYKYVKHPAYLSKNFMWWIAGGLFMSSGGAALLIPGCIGLTILSYIYYLRAKTEEKHLMQDPQYVAYALWIDTHGLFARIKRTWLFLPFSFLLSKFYKPTQTGQII